MIQEEFSAHSRSSLFLFIYPHYYAGKLSVDDTVLISPTHEVDCFKNHIALELEWNNKDPFFDRDLNNFRLLFDLRAISVGIILTRCDDLQDIIVRY